MIEKKGGGIAGMKKSGARKQGGEGEGEGRQEKGKGKMTQKNGKQRAVP